MKTLENLGFDANFKITCFECQPNQWSEFYCGTDNGTVIRYTRHQLLSNLPKMYTKSEINSLWTRVTAIEFNKFSKCHFLVGYSDGLIAYYSIANQKPLTIFDTNHSPVLQLKWLLNSSSAFIALNNSNKIFILNIINDNIKQFVSYEHQNERSATLYIYY